MVSRTPPRMKAAEAVALMPNLHQFEPTLARVYERIGEAARKDLGSVVVFSELIHDVGVWHVDQGAQSVARRVADTLKVNDFGVAPFQQPTSEDRPEGLRGMRIVWKEDHRG